MVVFGNRGGWSVGSRGSSSSIGNGDAIEPDMIGRHASRYTTHGNGQKFQVKDIIAPQYGYTKALIQPPAAQNEKGLNALHNIS